MKPNRSAAAVMAAAMAAAAAACKDVKGDSRPEPRPVRVVEVRAPDAPNTARYAVSIQPYEQIALSFKGSGYVDTIARRAGADGRSRPLQAGDTVAAGAVLARVRQEDYRERVSQAISSVQEIEAAQAKVQSDLDRAQYLFAAGALTKPEHDAAHTAFDQNTARLQSAKAALNLAANALQDSTLVALTSGVILDRKVEVGSLVNIGSVGFLLGDVKAVKAVFGVPDSVVGRIAPGQPLGVTTEAFHGSRFAGTVTTVAPSADPQTRVFDVEITIPNSDGRLRPGMIGSVEIPADAGAGRTAPNAAIPLSAVVRSQKNPSGYTVYVVEGRGEPIARARAVTLGAVQGNLVAVTAGLEPGERVIVMGSGLVTDGEAVKAIP